jgi:hypothetical protein
MLTNVCVEVHKHPAQTIGVVYQQGAPVVKSMQRMLRRLARNIRQDALADGRELTVPPRNS